jgi:hypothetical protein
MVEGFTHRTLGINRGRLFINNIITLSSESCNATSGAHCIHLCYTVCVYLRCRDFLPKCFSIEKLRLQEAQYWLFLNRDLLPLLLLHLYKQIFFSYMEKLCCFCDIGSSFYVFFQKCSKIFVTLIYELEQKSSLRTQKIAFTRSQISKFLGGGYPRTPLQMRGLMYVCISQLRIWIRPYHAFPDLSCEIYHDLSPQQLYQWIKMHRNRWHKQHRHLYSN